MELLLVHTPLVDRRHGAGSPRRSRRLGHDAIVPDLRSSALTGQPLEFVDKAVSSTPSDWSGPLVVGHRGAGFLLPSIAGGL
jgi:hypothetical protein